MATTILYALSGFLLLVAGVNFVMTWFRFSKYDSKHVWLWNKSCVAGIMYLSISGAFFGRALFDLIQIPYILSVSGSMFMLITALIFTYYLSKIKDSVFEEWTVIHNKKKDVKK